MYIPSLVTLWYLYLSVKKTDNDYVPNDLELLQVSVNLFITEILYYLVDACVYTYTDFNIFNLVMFFITQDIYFYTVHYLMHNYLYIFHNKHHTKYGPFYAWHTTSIDHVFLNLLSFGIPFYLFSNSSSVFIFLILLELYTSINGHTKKSKHSIHHKYTSRRLGSIYIIDKMLGTY
jgi:hypothetical protein